MNTFDLFQLRGQVALVTGGGRGLGFQISEALSDAGCAIALCSRKLETCEDAAQVLKSKGVDTKAYQCDLGNEEDINRVVNDVIEDFGKIDILVNNSGTTWGANVESMPLEAWEKVMRVNVTGTFLMSQAVGRLMIELASGKIINIASAAGLKAEPPEVLNAIGYSTSKAAVAHFTRDLARKWAHHGVYVNAIAPGIFPTKMTKAVLDRTGDAIVEKNPLNRIGDEDAIKGTALLLATEASDFMTGQVLSVDGGSTL
ncbi:gluconate 5-dehydrogenase [Lentibacillus halodurans]|uniref:Gluconate 5-dehydrogenase n=1 Tax=Lentibacillus halodurans TaxID=237679 RepID=A0A1I0ZDT6_9BACI|nr:SDR family oxidoreductase [Lentibacillus halodurans]SFB22578.1 gluconate 5-dehydrogenase [Lentibacillus halodurans]